MILPVAFVIGAAIGWMRAARRGGTRADKLQYAAAHALAVMLLALIVTLFLDRIGTI